MAATAKPSGIAAPDLRPGTVTEVVDSPVPTWLGRVPEQLATDDVLLLSPVERSRLERFVFERDRARYAGAHAELRRVLGRYFEVPAKLVLLDRQACPGCGDIEHGPPWLAAPRSMSLSISRSGCYWSAAINQNGPVGIDLEIGRDIDLVGLAGLVLSAAEQSYLDGQPELARRRAFYRCWTRKEAVTKACGTGLATELRAVDVRPGEAGPVEVRHGVAGGPAGWSVHDLALGPDLFAALAVPFTGTP